MAVFDFQSGDYTDPIPTNQNGSQVGSGIPWANGASQPSGAPAGFTWNDTMASYEPTPGTAATGSQATAPNNHSRIDQALASAQSTDDPNYWYGKLDSDPNGYGSAWDYWAGRIAQGDGALGVRQGTVQKFQDGPAASPSSYTPPPAGGNYSATNPFSDAATKNYIDLLNSRIQQLLTPQQNPDIGPLLDYMRKYFTQLQQPTYTDAQRATIATQQLDPMERQRQAELKNVALTMANRGITPGSGPYLQAERDINQKYDSLRAQAQGGQAVNEINLGRANQQQAVDVGSAIASLQNGMFQQQDQRANQAVTAASQIPNLAQQRLSQAIQLLNGNNVNPASLVGSLQGFQQQGLNQNSQDSQYWASIIAAMAKAFGL